MERAAKTTQIGEIRARFDKMHGRGFPRLQGNDGRSGHQAPRRVSQGRRRVQGRQEHARQAGPEEREVRRPALAIARGHDGYRLELRRSERGRQGREGLPQGALGEKLQIKAGLIDGSVLNAKAVEDQLATMPGKDELRATLLATLQAPLQQFVALLQAPAQNLVYLLAAKEEKKS